jgi:hypothetical protein
MYLMFISFPKPINPDFPYEFTNSTPARFDTVSEKLLHNSSPIISKSSSNYNNPLMAKTPSNPFCMPYTIKSVSDAPP